ncbi:hypothetical protein C6P45_005128 [Maudiozyma exigua]|uniref:Uncharacterized protein n=1 Tax=Maudiozyma exigua TaxID=34358 RepID=A0A9P6W9B3_MAUEX|nr:hypothetical protein C6P45_005128 [Kazachstania exigua]
MGDRISRGDTATQSMLTAALMRQPVKVTDAQDGIDGDPDKNGDHDEFFKIQKAAEILIDENDRDVYDYWYRR